MSSERIRVVATFTGVTDPAKILEAGKVVSQATRKEKGCIEYVLHQVIKL